MISALAPSYVNIESSMQMGRFNLLTSVTGSKNYFLLVSSDFSCGVSCVPAMNLIASVSTQRELQKSQRC